MKVLDGTGFYQTLFLGVALSLLSVDCGAQADSYMIYMGAVIYNCVNPETQPACFCATEEAKERSCPDCQKWAERTLGGMSFLNLDDYRNDPTQAAQGFWPDVAREVYGAEFPRGDELDQPISPEHLYKDFDEFGWVDLGAASKSKVGSLAVTSSWMGLVVSDDEGIQVVYLNNFAWGRLTAAHLNTVARDESVRYLLPREVFSQQRAIRLQFVTNSRRVV